MKDDILLVLADKWEEQSRVPDSSVTKGTISDEENAKGYRAAKRHCAKDLKSLVQLFGETD